LSRSDIRSGLFGIGGAIIGGLIVGLLLQVSPLSTKQKELPQYGETPSTEQPGMQLISAFSCKAGETKHIFTRGIEDNYSLLGEENSRTHERLKVLPGLTIVSSQLRAYDEVGNNKALSDYFELPPNISDGLFVTRLKGYGNSENDSLNIGDYLNRDPNMADIARHILSVRIHKLESAPGWHRQNDIYSARLSDIVFETYNQLPERSHSTLLEYVRAQDGAAIVDIAIADDTVVDFNAIAICERPVGDRGLTLTTHRSATSGSTELTALTCNADVTQEVCNPYYGDSICSEKLPLACFQDLSIPYPENDVVNIRFVDKWSGGKVAYTQPVAGNAFSSIDKANEYCSQKFGPDWRVVSWHDGGSSDVLAYNYEGTASGRAWVDIGDQPDATCWSRSAPVGDIHEGHDH